MNDSVKTPLLLNDENKINWNYRTSCPTYQIKSKDLKSFNENDNNNNNNNDYSIIVGRYSSNSKGVTAQCLVTGAVFILMASCGMPIGFSAILLPQLLDNNGTLHIDTETGSWIASVHSLATPIGALVSGPIMEFIGRRGSLQFAVIPLCSGWITMAFAKYVHHIFIGRILSGFAVGLTAVPSQVILSEMADPKLRGMLVGGTIAAYSAGILFIYALGAILRWDFVAIYGTLPSIIGFFTLCMIHESPAWLIKQNRMEAAKKALLWLRGGDKSQVIIEASILEARANANFVGKSINPSLREKVLSEFLRMFNPGVIKPMIIINVFNVLQLLSGTYVIIFYGVDLMKHIGVNNLNIYLWAALLAVMRLMFSIVGCFLLLKVDRRTLALISGIITGSSAIILASYLLLQKGISPYDIYVLGSCLLIYVAASTIGFLTLPKIMVGELLPHRVRALGGSFTFFLFHITLFGVTKYFPQMSESIGMPGMFLLFANFAFMTVAFTYFFLPETKDRTHQEIEDYFQKGNIFWISRKEERKQTINLMAYDNQYK